ncbi:MAG: SH3 domain-containing protein [Peptostreptococcaceae bacterium]
MTKKNVIISMAITSSVLGMNAIEANASSTGVVNTSALNVRSGAGTNHSIIGKLYKGDKVDILESSGGWYKIKLSNGKTGWSSSQYIDKVNNSEDNNSTDNNIIKKGTVNTSALNVRSGAGTSYSVIGKLYKGDKVDILSYSNNWYKIKLSNGKIGWCSSQYITVGSSNGNDNNNTEKPESGKSGTVNTSSLNVRSGAGTNYSIIDKVYKGDKVDILTSSNSWYKVKLSNGKTGWCSSQYITIGSSSDNNNDNNNTEKPESGKSGVVNTSSLNVRSGAGTNYSIIDKVHKGDKVDILASSNSWYKVKLSNGKIGWCSSTYITIGAIPPTEDSSGNSSKVDAVINLAMKQIGKPYVWGATGPDSFDCSGLTSYVYKHGANYNLPRTSTEQAKVGKTVSKSDLKPGDLIFSSTNGTGNVSHVGIYIGNNEMIHAPKPGQNVHIVKINTTYWNNVYLHAKRVI